MSSVCKAGLRHLTNSACHKPILGTTSCPSSSPMHRGVGVQREPQEGQRGLGAAGPAGGTARCGKVQPARGTSAFERVYVCNA